MESGRNAIPAILCERPPRRFAPPLLYQEGSSHVRTIFAPQQNRQQSDWNKVTIAVMDGGDDLLQHNVDA